MKRCPICQGAVPAAHKGAFCSDRCKAIDLGKWLSGDYVVSRPLREDDADGDWLAVARHNLQEPS